MKTRNTILPPILLLIAIYGIPSFALDEPGVSRQPTGKAADLPEVLVESRKNPVLHILAYLREYSTMTTYSDTVYLFREKLVDYMLPIDRKIKFRGWSNPRLLTSKSYYRFYDNNGLDSVSDECRFHFSWSDWMGLVPGVSLPDRLKTSDICTDTLTGKYRPTQIWAKNNDRISVDVDVLADTANRCWAPDFSGFFRRNFEFDKFRIRYNYDNAISDTLRASDLTHYSYSIESVGRGRNMFRFARMNQPYYVSTDAEIYVLGKEYITEMEAHKWDNRKYDLDDLDINEPDYVPPLSANTQDLITRVERLDKGQIRLGTAPDKKLMGKYISLKKTSFGRRLLSLFGF